MSDEKWHVGTRPTQDTIVIHSTRSDNQGMLIKNEKNRDGQTELNSNGLDGEIRKDTQSLAGIQPPNIEEQYNEKFTNDVGQEPSSVEESDSASLNPEDHVYPEGGFRAWLVVFGSWCGMFASLGLANSLASFQAYISDNQLSSYSPGQIGWIFSIYAFLSFVCGIYIGPLFDVYGPRWLILPGSALLVLTMFLLGVCHEYWHFILVFGVLGGFGTALLFTPSIAACGHYFHKKRGNATGIAASGGAFGGVVFPLMLQSLIPQIGFAWATRILGFILIFLCIIANILIKANLPPSQLATSPHPDFKILRQPAFFMTVCGCFLIEWALFVPLTYITSYAIKEGFTQAFSYQILPILSAASIFGRWLPGLYSDVIGRYNMALLSIALTLISVFAIWLPFGNVTPGLVVFAVVFGFASGSNISLTPVCVGQLCETRDYGRYYATCYTIVAFGCLTGIPIAGEIVQRCGGEYWGLIVFTGTCYCGALGAFAVARGFAGGWGVWVKY